MAVFAVHLHGQKATAHLQQHVIIDTEPGANAHGAKGPARRRPVTFPARNAHGTAPSQEPLRLGWTPLLGGRPSRRARPAARLAPARGAPQAEQQVCHCPVVAHTRAPVAPLRFSRRPAWAPALHAHRACSCVPRGPLPAVHRHTPGQGEADRRQHPHGRGGQVRTRTGAHPSVSPIRHALCWAPVAPTRSGVTCEVAGGRCPLSLCSAHLAVDETTQPFGSTI